MYKYSVSIVCNLLKFLIIPLNFLYTKNNLVTRMTLFKLHRWIQHNDGNWCFCVFQENKRQVEAFFYMHQVICKTPEHLHLLAVSFVAICLPLTFSGCFLYFYSNLFLCVFFQPLMRPLVQLMQSLKKDLSVVTRLELAKSARL